jgi:mycothiol synthase
VLVAAGAVRPGPKGAMATGLVDPAVRGRGIGGALLDWALATAAALPPAAHAAEAGGATGCRVTVETESLTEPAAKLFAGRGLRQVVAEDVMRLDLTGPPPDVPLPDGVRLEPWTEDRAERFFAVYSAAFAERPSFPNWSVKRWVGWLTGDEVFRPDWCALAVDPEAGDVAFITCAVGWIVQVGVRPDLRHRRLGAGLVCEAARRMRAAGQPAVLLDVNVDNPGAGDLYRRLGFEVIGRRGRWIVDNGDPVGDA